MASDKQKPKWPLPLQCRSITLSGQPLVHCANTHLRGSFLTHTHTHTHTRRAHTCGTVFRVLRPLSLQFPGLAHAVPTEGGAVGGAVERVLAPGGPVARSSGLLAWAPKSRSARQRRCVCVCVCGFESVSAWHATVNGSQMHVRTDARRAEGVGAAKKVNRAAVRGAVHCVFTLQLKCELRTLARSEGQQKRMSTPAICTFNSNAGTCYFNALKFDAGVGGCVAKTKTVDSASPRTMPSPTSTFGTRRQSRTTGAGKGGCGPHSSDQPRPPVHCSRCPACPSSSSHARPCSGTV